MSKIMITGGAGFIGSHLVDRLALQHEVIVVDDLSTGFESNLIQSKHLFYNVDVTDVHSVKEVLQKEKPEVIYHLAAVASVVRSLENPVECHRVNFESTLNLLELCSDLSIKKFIFASSAAVYGDEPTLPKNEYSAIKPLSGYGIDKFSSEQYVLDYTRRKKIEGTCFRFFNVYGERQDPSSPYAGVLSLFLNEVKNNSHPKLKIFGDGEQTRDFIYIKDVVSALERTLDESSMVGGLYNLGSGKSISLNEIVTILNQLSKKEISVEYLEKRVGDIQQSESDISRIKSMNWAPQFSFDQGIRDYWNKLN